MKKIDVLLPLALILGLLTATIVLSLVVYRDNKRNAQESPLIHYYDYIIEVDGTNSVEVYTLYNCEHVEIGRFTSDNTDSLKTLIFDDNI